LDVQPDAALPAPLGQHLGRELGTVVEAEAIGSPVESHKLTEHPITPVAGIDVPISITKPSLDSFIEDFQNTKPRPASKRIVHEIERQASLNRVAATRACRNLGGTRRRVRRRRFNRRP
jgi:hypothetical protein